jgi:RNA polymerase sigma-70 factor (ECF subfamily)
MSKTSYRELAENFIKTRSERDYKVLYDKIKPGLETYVFNVVKDNEAKDDIVTNTLTKLWTKADQYDPQYQITTWLYRIAFNECLGWIRQRNKKRSIDALQDSGIEVSRYYARTSARDLLVEMEYKSEEDYLEEDNELMNRYESALRGIENLKPMYKGILEDRLLNNMKYEDIAKKHDLPLQTIKNRIRRGKAIIAGKV